MKECEEHRFGKWALCPYGGQFYGKESRSCMDCGASQVRSVQRINDPLPVLPDKP